MVEVPGHCCKHDRGRRCPLVSFSNIPPCMRIIQSYNRVKQVARTKDDDVWLVSDAVERGQELIGRANSICTLAVLGRGLTGASNTLNLVN